MKSGSQLEYAGYLGCSPAYVSQLKRRGKLVMVKLAEGERVDFAATDALLAAARDPDKEGVRQRHRRDRAARLKDGAPAPKSGQGVAALGGGPADESEAPPDKSDPQLYNQRLRAQIRAANADADMKQLDLIERAGALVKASIAEDRLHHYGREVRDLFLAMPARIAADLAAEMDPQVVGNRLTEEIKATLNELSRRAVT